MKATRRGPVGATAVLVISVLHAGATFSITRQSDVKLVSGVWLALARDLCDGLFYRDLITPRSMVGLGTSRSSSRSSMASDALVSEHATSLLPAVILVTPGTSRSRILRRATAFKSPTQETAAS